MSNRVFVAFYSRKGHTRELGQAVCQGLEEASIPVSCLEFEAEKEVNVLSASASSFTHSAEPIKECQVELDDDEWKYGKSGFSLDFKKGKVKGDLKGADVTVRCKKLSMDLHFENLAPPFKPGGGALPAWPARNDQPPARRDPRLHRAALFGA